MAYYAPNISRPNLFLLTEALVNRVILEKDGNYVAKGVEYCHHGNKFTVLCSREVILCAGSVQSPQLLELSGIGNPEILHNAGIEVKVENRKVGENLQEHMSQSYSSDRLVDSF